MAERRINPWNLEPGDVFLRYDPDEPLAVVERPGEAALADRLEQED